MKNFDSFFSEEKLIELLCKYRAKEANKRHGKHMVRNVSLHESTNKICITDKHSEFKFLQDKFPTRRNWKKLNEYERKLFKDSIKINQQRLYKSYLFVKREVDIKGSAVPNWYRNLMDFVEEIRKEVYTIEQSTYEMNLPKIRGIKKEEKKGVIVYRPIALYQIKDKIICSLTSKYLVEYFENIFVELDCSFAFRPKNIQNLVPDHHDCIQKIFEYKNLNPNLWVAECDIQKFFDTVQHNHILDVLDKFSTIIEKKIGIKIDSCARKIFLLFLNSFSFQESVLKLDALWFEKNGLPFGEFKWVNADLNSKFGVNYTSDFKIGVPQGNAISCFIANLILHSVDEKIKNYDSDMLYIRYCDDMILMHPDQVKCSEALNIFTKGINENFLLYHKAEKFSKYKSVKVSHDFWKSKSKEPFFWNDKNFDDNCIPWVSFVGYQIDFNGRIRVRKSTLKKETKKQISETQKIIKGLGKFHHSLEIIDKNARLSKNQIVFRTQQKLISMSVGRVTIHNHKRPSEQGLCWTNGFKKLTLNRISSKQLRYLDRRRHLQIGRINRELIKIVREKDNINFPEELKKIYFGAAFSYYNYLKHN